MIQTPEQMWNEEAAAADSLQIAPALPPIAPISSPAPYTNAAVVAPTAAAPAAPNPLSRYDSMFRAPAVTARPLEQMAGMNWDERSAVAGGQTYGQIRAEWDRQMSNPALSMMQRADNMNAYFRQFGVAPEAATWELSKATGIPADALLGGFLSNGIAKDSMAWDRANPDAPAAPMAAAPTAAQVAEQAARRAAKVAAHDARVAADPRYVAANAARAAAASPQHTLGFRTAMNGGVMPQDRAAWDQAAAAPAPGMTTPNVGVSAGGPQVFPMRPPQVGMPQPTPAPAPAPAANTGIVPPNMAPAPATAPMPGPQAPQQQRAANAAITQGAMRQSIMDAKTKPAVFTQPGSPGSGPIGNELGKM